MEHGYKEGIINYYKSRYNQYGIDEKSLGWTKNKQKIRFKTLLGDFDLSNRSILDLGCGFGDLYEYIKAKAIPIKNYIGVDIVEDFIDVLSKRTENDDKVKIIKGDFIDMYTGGGGYTELRPDYIVSSGIFGHRVYADDEENYQYINKMFEKAFSVCEVAMSFDFLSDKVDYRLSSDDFFASPLRILEIAYNYSRRIILNNSVMPFEFNITIFKDDSFRKETTVFKQYELEEGIHI